MQTRAACRIVVLAALTLAAGPVSAQVAPKPYEAISLFGQPLVSPDPTTRALAEYDQAKRDFDAAATEDAYIWLGRRAGYLGRFREAIAVYTEGLAKFPMSFRLYRHRGHRYISIRQFGRAIADFEQAAALVKGRPLEVEPDGAPNKAGIPLSNTQFNVYYHLGLAYFLTRDFVKAEAAYRECLRWSKNDDSVVATSDWLYITLRRTGRVAEAAEVLAPMRGGLTVIEDGAYLERLLMFKGEIPEEEFARERPDETAPEKAIRAYGLGLAALWRGETERARTLFTHLVRTTSWASFATIAAEVELADLTRRAPECASAGSALSAWSLAWNTYDLDLVQTLFASGLPPAYELAPTYFSSEKPGRIEGFEAVIAHHRSVGFVPGGKTSDARLWLEGLVIKNHQDAIALATGIWGFDRDVAASAPVQRGPVSFVLQNTADGWRIIHAHFANDPPARRP
jgi:tetratricopeptide (TPR) repeat protein